MTLEVPRAALDQRWNAHAERLELLLARFARFARALNLTGASNTHQIREHMHEALAAVIAAESALGGEIGDERVWLDVGSGGGFPGLVVAAVTDCQLVLVEPRQRRAAFLKSSLGVLKRQRAVVVRARATSRGWVDTESGAKGLPEAGQVDIAGARAVMAPEAWSECAEHFLRPGGLCLFHLQASRPLPLGWTPISRAESSSWAVVAARGSSEG